MHCECALLGANISSVAAESHVGKVETLVVDSPLRIAQSTGRTEPSLYERLKPVA
jgi:hypothetical protein